MIVTGQNEADVPWEPPAWWRRKKVAIPAGVVGGLLVIGALAGEDQDGSDGAALRSESVDATSQPPLTSATTTIVDPTTSLPATTAEPSTTTTIATTSTTSVAPTTTVSAEVQRAVGELAALSTAEPAPDRSPFEREFYDGDGWGDADADCQSTRHELLIEYSLDDPVLTADECFVVAGRWIDAYTGDEYLAADDVSIDHVVPLAEAHRSGAWRWDDASKRALANDLTAGVLLVVGRDTNQAKADSTPAEWLPSSDAARCQYAIDWTTTKARYGLSVTADERDALRSVLDTCAGVAVRPVGNLEPAPVVVTTPTTTTTTTIAPTAGPGFVELLSCERRSEVVVIANTGGEAVSLSGYQLHDEDVNHSTDLGEFGTLQPGEQLRILTGDDPVAGAGEVVWQRRPIWNNDGDTAFLNAPDGSQQTVRC